MADPVTQTTDPADRLKQLEAQLADEREKREAAEATARALTSRTAATAPAGDAPRRPVAGVHIPYDRAKAIAEQLGGDWTPDAVQVLAAPVLALFAEAAGPVLHGLTGMVDTLDLVQTRQELPDYPTVAEEAEKLRKELQGQGRFVSRKECVALVKARRLDDPAYVDQLVEQRTKQREAEQAAAASRAAAGTTEGTTASTQTAGPSAGKGGKLDPASFATLSAEEMTKQLERENVAF